MIPRKVYIIYTYVMSIFNCRIKSHQLDYWFIVSELPIYCRLFIIPMFLPCTFFFLHRLDIIKTKFIEIFGVLGLIAVFEFIIYSSLPGTCNKRFPVINEITPPMRFGCFKCRLVFLQTDKRSVL